MVEDLRRKIYGDVRNDTLSRYIYSLDASIYQIEIATGQQSGA